MSNKYTEVAASPPDSKANTLARPLNLHSKDHGSLAKPQTITAPTSQAFNIHQALNPLIAAASPILIALNGIDNEQYSGSTTLLYESLISEIKTFEEKARKLEYRSAIILAARYFICSYIDERLASSNSHLQSHWQKQPLLKTLQNETYGGERFFLILDRASDDAKANLDLLELGFLILSLGYKGKYTQPSNNPRELEHIRDNLYTLIKKYRGDLDPALFVGDNHLSSAKKSSMKKMRKRIPHLAIATGIFILGLFAVYIPYQIHLNELVKPVDATLNSIANSDTQPAGNLHD